ncbi:MAG: YesL family protein [Lachnospiraceae bacterium]|nr:YesL family protein [Lachnospiraceae bacterium]
MRFFDYDSPLMSALTKVANLMILNLLTLICCIPVITAGAALTALHYMCLKMVRNEDSYIVKGYFVAFKESFKQATKVWLVLLLIILVLAGDFLIINLSGIQFPYWFHVVFYVVGIIALFECMMVFPIMGKFENTTLRTMKNALIISVAKFPITILMVVMNIVPIAIVLYFLQIVPIALMFGFAVPAYFSEKLLNKYFKKLEEHILEAQGLNKPDATEEEDDGVEKIFNDQLDEALAGKKD